MTLPERGGGGCGEVGGGGLGDCGGVGCGLRGGGGLLVGICCPQALQKRAPYAFWYPQAVQKGIGGNPLADSFTVREPARVTQPTLPTRGRNAPFP